VKSHETDSETEKKNKQKKMNIDILSISFLYRPIPVMTRDFPGRSIVR